MPLPYLDIHNATVFQKSTKVFDRLNLQLFRGQNTCILGPNGSGKTTLVKLLTRELYPVHSENSYVKIDGSEKVVIWELRKKIGLVSQDFQNQYDPHIFAKDVVMSGLFGSVGIHKHEHVSAEHIELTEGILNKYQLNHIANKRYWHLSTGQQRKLLLARALIHNPEILILDEPTNGLDIKATHQFIGDLQHLAEQGLTLLLITHHIQEIIPQIERMILLKQGAIYKDRPKHELMDSQTLSSLYDTPLILREEQGFYQVFPKQH